MKRILVLLTAFMLLSVQGFSQFGIKGGLNSNSFGDLDLKDSDTKAVLEKKTGYHVGLLYRIKVPLIGLAIQPELQYSQTNGKISIAGENMLSSYYDMETGTTLAKADGNLKTSYLQLPVALQWGIDLMLFRPYIQAVPYVGYSFGSNKNLAWDMDKFRYGIGLGAGLDIWKLQISGKYSWDLGKAADFKWAGAKTFKGGKSKGFELSLAILF